MPLLMQRRNVLSVPKGTCRQKQASRGSRNIRRRHSQALSIHRKAQLVPFFNADLARPIASCQRKHALSECFARLHHVLLLSVHLHEINCGAAFSALMRSGAPV